MDEPKATFRIRTTPGVLGCFALLVFTLSGLGLGTLVYWLTQTLISWAGAL